MQFPLPGQVVNCLSIGEQIKAEQFNGWRIAAGSTDGLISIWGIEKGVPLASFKGSFGRQQGFGECTAVETPGFTGYQGSR